MKKTMAFVLIGLLVCMSMAVVAQEFVDEDSAGIVVPPGGILYQDSEGMPAFTFVTYLTSYTVTYKKVYSKGLIPASVGSNCQVGEYIVLMACTDSAGTSCKRAYIVQDFRKDSSTDLLMKDAYAGQSWWTEFSRNKYVAYECHTSTSGSGRSDGSTTPVVEKPAAVDVTKFGRVTSISVTPATVAPGGSVKIIGKYQTLVDGKFLLEATIPQASRTLATAITASKSTCDSSVYAASSIVNGVKDTVYTYEFTVKAPLVEGTYDVTAYSWTDCAAKGGKQITERIISKAITVKQAKTCQPVEILTVGLKDYGVLVKTDGTLNPAWPTTIGPCNINDIVKLCGTVDLDRDGVPDKCDSCPSAKGSPIAVPTGCHPCSGKAATDSCWTTNQKDYGIPENIADARNPVVGTALSCTTNNNVQICDKRLDGKAIYNCQDVQTCDFGCEVGACKAAPATPEPTCVPSKGTVTSCNGNDVVAVTTACDGKTTSAIQKTCSNGCDNGACLKAVSPPPVNPPVTTPDPECTSSSNCPATYYCDVNTQKCIKYVPPVKGCTADSDCTGQVCNKELGICQDKTVTPPQCTIAADCKLAGEVECLSGKCIVLEPTVVQNNTVTCAQNTELYCTSDGSTIVQSYCVNGMPKPTGNVCPVTGGGITTGGGAGGTGDISSTDYSTWYIVGGIVVVVAVAGYFFRGKKGKRGKRR